MSRKRPTSCDIFGFALGWHVATVWTNCCSDLANRSKPSICHFSTWHVSRWGCLVQLCTLCNVKLHKELNAMKIKTKEVKKPDEILYHYRYNRAPVSFLKKVALWTYFFFFFFFHIWFPLTFLCVCLPVPLLSPRLSLIISSLPSPRAVCLILICIRRFRDYFMPNVAFYQTSSTGCCQHKQP